MIGSAEDILVARKLNTSYLLIVVVKARGERRYIANRNALPVEPGREISEATLADNG